MKPCSKLVILDRDGVINQDSDDFIKSVDEWIPLPGSLEAMARLTQAGWTVTVATNQSGLARGLYTEDALHAMHQKMRALLAALGGRVDYLVYCPHGPDEISTCRKPLPGMYQEIAAHFGCSLVGVPVIGDSLRDLEAAIAVNARPMLVRSGKGERTLLKGGLPENTPVFDDLSAAVDHLLLHG
ncbi:MAG: D-glycero-beta-D-manno-heptose-1,7-bisphosphate 7-phosphatase [Gammaproteobacteria bacterium 28-57-27]|nr:MAG: D-glycero-beta-D-manno-heptose-1,7-bisphosphate 7-phosphatase [Gammaproteobacteria bacterium 28-57-27]